MEVNYSKEQLKEQINSHVGNRSHGYFITLDTQYTTLNSEFSKDFLDRCYDKKFSPFVDALNHYCYGRSFKRRDNYLRTIVAIEIGETTQRLHGHFVMLHNADCKRTLSDIDTRTRLIWQNIVPRAGSDFIDVKEFDSSSNWCGYITKRFTAFKLQYDFPSVKFH